MGCHDGYTNAAPVLQRGRTGYVGGYSGENEYGQGGLLEWASSAADKGYTFGKSIEQGLTGQLCDSLPSWVKSAMDLQRKNPWRAVMLGIGMSAITYSPYLVAPFTFPLAVVQVPLYVFLFQVRFAFDVILECGSVTRAVRNNACDLRAILQTVNPQTPSGRVIQEVLTLAGQGDALDALHAWTAKSFPFIDALCQGNLPSIAATTNMAVATTKMSGDPKIIAMARRTETQLARAEDAVIDAAAELDVLSPRAEGFTESGRETISAMSISGPTGRLQPKTASQRRGKKKKKASGIRARAKAEREKRERDAMAPITTEGDLLDDDRPGVFAGLFGGNGVPWVPIAIGAVVVGGIAMSRKK